MPRTLRLNAETLAELTSDELSVVIGAAASGSCTIANVCINTGGGGDPAPTGSTEYFRVAAC